MIKKIKIKTENFRFSDQKSGRSIIYLCSEDDKSAKFLPALSLLVTLLDLYDHSANANSGKNDKTFSQRKSFYGENKQKTYELNFNEFSEILSKDSCYIKHGKFCLAVEIFSEWDGIYKVDRTAALNNEDMITLRTADKGEFKAPLKMLTEESILFRKMFASNMREKTDQTVDIYNFSTDVVRQFQAILCTGKPDILPSGDEDIIMNLFEMARYYKMEDLQRFCLRLLKSQITRKNVIKITWLCLQCPSVYDDKSSLFHNLFTACCTRILW